MIDTVALREKVLDLAIRGKLVPQDPNDEPASVLLERIRAQKQQMVKEGKLKAKDIKDDSIIFVGEDNLHYEKFANGTVKCIEDEIPFELPSGWGWTRIGNIASVKGGKRVPKGMTFSTEPTHHAYVRVTDMKNHTVNLSDLKYIDETVFAEIKNYTIAKNDLYITIAGTIGAVGEFPDELDGMNLTENAVKVSAIGINKSFLCFIMQTEFVQKQFKHKTYQVAMPKLGLERILTTLIPVCGIVTQQKICDAIQNSTKYIAIIGENYSELSNTIAVIKSKILDLAIRGKLVPQNPDDEPASALLERIRAEKEVLIKQGKIKRDKKESVIFKGEDNSYYRNYENESVCIDENIPFEIPSNWEWCNLSMIGSTNIGLTYKPEEIIESGTMVLRSSNIVNGKIDLSDLVRVKTSIRDNQYIEENDILICARNGSKALVGKCAIFSGISERASFGAFMAVYRTAFFKYVYYFLNSNTFRSTFNSDDTKQINQLTQDMIKNSLIPLPPFEEQLRIVETIENVFAQLETIVESLN